MGWGCAESLELHRVSNFVAKNQGYIHDRRFDLASKAIHKWRGTISTIFHSAVRRFH